MSRIVGPIAFMLALIGVALGWQMILPVQATRDTAPPFAVHTLEGHPLRLTDLRGRPVVIEFWATWSGPSRTGLQRLNALQERYGGRGLMVLGLSVDEAPPQTVQASAARLGVRFPLAIADEGILDDYGPIRSVPTTFLISRGGRILRRIVGYVDEETLEGFIREIL